MMRITCVTAALLLSAAAILPAQSRNRGAEFGLSEATWCRDAGDADFYEVRASRDNCGRGQETSDLSAPILAFLNARS
jgi:hypothetical protein